MVINNTKSTAEKLNGNLHKSRAIHYQNAIKQMIRAFIKKCPKEVLIDVLKSEKIISRNWSARGNKYMEYEKP